MKLRIVSPHRLGEQPYGCLREGQEEGIQREFGMDMCVLASQVAQIVKNLSAM